MLKFLFLLLLIEVRELTQLCLEKVTLEPLVLCESRELFLERSDSI